MKSTSSSTTHKRKSRTESRRGIVAALLTVILLCAMLSGCGKEYNFNLAGDYNAGPTNFTSRSNVFDVNDVTFSVYLGLNEKDDEDIPYYRNPEYKEKYKDIEYIVYAHLAWEHQSYYDCPCVTEEDGKLSLSDQCVILLSLDYDDLQKDIYRYEEKNKFYLFPFPYTGIVRNFYGQAFSVTLPPEMFENEEGCICFHTLLVNYKISNVTAVSMPTPTFRIVGFARDGDRVIFNKKGLSGIPSK